MTAGTPREHTHPVGADAAPVADADAAAGLAVGDLVVVTDQPGVLRLERRLADGRWRALRYSDGGFVVAEAADVRRCPPGTRAAP